MCKSLNRYKKEKEPQASNLKKDPILLSCYETYELYDLEVVSNNLVE